MRGHAGILKGNLTKSYIASHARLLSFLTTFFTPKIRYNSYCAKNEFKASEFWGLKTTAKTQCKKS